MKFLFVVCLLIFSVIAPAKTIYLIRHAEKVNDGSKDPVLTEQGQSRADGIAALLSTAGITHVFATDYQRTQLTAKPLADYLDLAITLYDPRKLTEFAEQLKLHEGNALVVGHSNTTPVLAHLLTAQPVFSLDEADFDYVFQVHLAGDKSSLDILRSLPTNATKSLSNLQTRQENYFTGQSTFQVLFKGEVVGKSTHEFNSDEQSYDLHETTTIENMNIDTNTAVTVSKSLQPVKMRVQGSMGVPIDIDLLWHENQITGHSEMARDSYKQQGKLIINESLKANTLERTSMMMLAHIMPVEINRPLFLRWFNGYDADQRLIEVKYHGEEIVSVPAGTFETYKIEYSGGAPSQYFWIDKKQPKVVKIEVIKKPWQYELLTFEQK